MKTSIIFLAALFTFAAGTYASENWFRREARGGDLPGGLISPSVERYHDDEKKVTCWVLRFSDGPAISCIPDKHLQ